MSQRLIGIVLGCVVLACVVTVVAITIRRTEPLAVNASETVTDQALLNYAPEHYSHQKEWIVTESGRGTVCLGFDEHLSMKPPVHYYTQHGEWPSADRRLATRCAALRQLAERPDSSPYQSSEFIHKDIAATLACADLFPVPVAGKDARLEAGESVTCPMREPAK